jgi:hypothetical protein
MEWLERTFGFRVDFCKGLNFKDYQMDWRRVKAAAEAERARRRGLRPG